MGILHQLSPVLGIHADVIAIGFHLYDFSTICGKLGSHHFSNLFLYSEMERSDILGYRHLLIVGEDMGRGSQLLGYLYPMRTGKEKTSQECEATQLTYI